MAASKPVIHGRDHLPGGADPIPAFDASVYYASVSVTYTSPAASSMTPADFTGSDIETNDGGGIADTHASPFAGSVFEWDTSTYPEYPLAIVQDGLYLIELYCRPLHLVSLTDQYFVGVERNVGGGSARGPVHPFADSRYVMPSGPPTNSSAVAQQFLYIYDTATTPYRTGVNFAHNGPTPDSATVGMYVVRFGPPIPPG